MKPDCRIVALLVAAGSGSRAGSGRPKQYRRIAGMPLLAHAIRHLRHPSIDEIRVVIGAGQDGLYRDATAELRLPAPVTGGPERRQSVLLGLEAIAAEGGADLVLIHDAARPFLPAAVIDRLVEALATAKAAVPALAVVDSLAQSGDTLGDGVERDSLLQVQTPQGFHFDAILAAHRQWQGSLATDDAQVARAAGLSVAIVTGDTMLGKLTFDTDFERAERYLAGSLVTRVGMGFDVHAFGPGVVVHLGGLAIPYSHSLRGHSDADVVLHAVTDALLGAAGEGDIGDHFPPSDARWRGAASSIFVDHACALIEARGGTIDHVDVTIICEAPKISQHRLAMRQSIAAMLRVPPGRVSVKATTTERLGFTGRNEGMATQAVATIRLPERL